jgi:hypothetical protein
MCVSEFRPSNIVTRGTGHLCKYTVSELRLDLRGAGRLCKYLVSELGGWHTVAYAPVTWLGQRVSNIGLAPAAHWRRAARIGGGALLSFFLKSVFTCHLLVNIVYVNSVYPAIGR